MDHRRYSNPDRRHQAHNRDTNGLRPHTEPDGIHSYSDNNGYSTTANTNQHPRRRQPEISPTGPPETAKRDYNFLGKHCNDGVEFSRPTGRG